MEGGSRPGIEELKDDLFPLVEDRRDAALKTILVDLHPADIAELLSQLGDEDDQKYLFGLIADLEHASAVLSELPSSVREPLIEDIPHEDLADLVGEMSSDDAADLVQELPADVAARVMKVIEPQEREAMTPLLGYHEETAGGIMATEVLLVSDEATIGDAREQVRHRGEDLEPFFFVYVVDRTGRLVGVLSLKDLVMERSGTPVKSVLHAEPITVTTDLDQEEVANLFRRYDLIAVPVVGEHGRLLGRITIDDVMDVMKEEADEDMARMAGTDEEQFTETSVRRITFYRLPWILASLLGGLLSGTLLDHFSHTLAVALSLVAFVPVIMAMGGNAGSQAAVTMVRRLALRNLSGGDVAGLVWREARVGVFLGMIAGISLGLVAYLIRGAWYYGVVVGVSMIAAIMVAVTMGTVLPLVFHRLKVDPAIATGPFVSMSNDATGLLIYFGLATLLLRVGGVAP